MWNGSIFTTTYRDWFLNFKLDWHQILFNFRVSSFLNFLIVITIDRLSVIFDEIEVWIIMWRHIIQNLLPVSPLVIIRLRWILNTLLPSMMTTWCFCCLFRGSPDYLTFIFLSNSIYFWRHCGLGIRVNTCKFSARREISGIGRYKTFF